MIKPICKDMFFLGMKSREATIADLSVGKDLRDTLAANRDRCVGMAANMIGVSKRVIIFNDDLQDQVMYNPMIVGKAGRYETEEGCLSLTGTRKTVRYTRITVEYLDETFRKQKKVFTGYTAEIIQHEVDHLDGIII